MPNVRKYNSGSIVYFENDKNDEIYVLKQGAIILISTPPGRQEENRENIKVGEFFGIKSALGQYPREETAQATTETILVVFNINEFKNYIKGNIRLLLQMLQVFSNDLRHVHLQVRSILKEDNKASPAFELLNIAQVFHKNSNFSYATHAYECYLANYPAGKNIAQAQKFLELSKQETNYPEDSPELLPEEQVNPQVDDFVNSLTPKEGGGDAPVANPEIQTAFHEAQGAMNKNDIVSAIKNYQKCIEIEGDAQTQEGKEMISQCYYEIALCFVKIEKQKEALLYFSNYLRKFPTGNYIRHCLYQLGLIYNEQGNVKQAGLLFHKIATMQPHDELTSEARKKLESIK